MLRADSKQYKIVDEEFDGLTMSTTTLHGWQGTDGHSHDWEEGYYIVKGVGKIRIGSEVKKMLHEGDFFIIEPNKWHQVFNGMNTDLIFICVWRKHD